MTDNQKLLLLFLSERTAGEVVTTADILSKTGWKPSTLNTYRSKHYIDPFLTNLGKGRFRVVCNGGAVTADAIERAFTQVRPGLFVPSAGMVIRSVNNQYKLLSLMGSGAVAQVWRCRSLIDNSERAAKIMSPREDLLAPDVIPDVKRRFAREARNGQRMSNPHVIAYLDHGDIDEHPFLIMELAERNLASLLESQSLPLSESISVIRDCIKGLAYIHSSGCVHRDVKPQNILQLGSRYMLGDLGVVKWSDMNPSFTSAATMTVSSIRLGSWYYMPPEQRRASHIASPASDIYALGVSWYEMLTQNTPDPTDVAVRNYPSSTDSPTIDGLIRRMLDYSPEKRPTLSHIAEAIGS